MENASSMRVKYGRERQLSGIENRRRNYAIVAVCIRHSHSIINSHYNQLIFLVKIFSIFPHTVM